MSHEVTRNKLVLSFACAHPCPPVAAGPVRRVSGVSILEDPYDGARLHMYAGLRPASGTAPETDPTAGR
eukprot:CAMPEP_0206021260 /NCGR_PEP_ID=MMETSP1464-20131121/32574_1 /ASSEMBLY_ACC=CAM_ASM_001124 /TAXON_ID=119497 /ORGANISM="Exanthemachrysis gayraliae, Strain RCC1523" /LENGTH=68 /DNA_ID=CAMNT_0053395205 /DNA_START=38 /DNA_END=240 /DNA_ORIENTATION=-